MVHQYDHRDRQSGLSRKYTEYIENEPDVNKKIAIQTEILGIKNQSVVPTENPLSLKPNQKFIEEYEKQAILKREKQAKALVRESLNEKGEKYAAIWNNEDFRKIHDPIGIVIFFIYLKVLLKNYFIDGSFFIFVLNINLRTLLLLKRKFHKRKFVKFFPLRKYTIYN